MRLAFIGPGLCALALSAGIATADNRPGISAVVPLLAPQKGNQDCNDEQGVRVKAGADDKLFHLERAADDACRALEQP